MLWGFMGTTNIKTYIMKKDDVELIESQEFFELTLNVDSSRIPAAYLIEYLRNTDKLFKSINQTLNEKYAIGFNEITLEVVPFEEGSFKIPIWIKKISVSTIMENAIGSIIGGIGLILLTNKQCSQEVNTDKGTVVVESKEFLKSKSTVDALCDIATLTLHNDSIKDLSVTYEREDGSREKVNISRSVLNQVAQISLEDEETTIIQTNVRLEIVSPVFSSNPSSWKVANQSGSPFSATMQDEAFLKIMDEKKIAFAKGDTIIADIETRCVETVAGVRPRYYITKVHSYPHYQKVLSDQESEDLFSDVGK